MKAAPPLYLSTLGRLSLTDAGGDVRSEDSKPLLILAFLVAQASGEATRDHLAALIWPDVDPTSQKRSLRQGLHTLRKFGAGSAIELDGGSVRLNRDAVACDLWEVEALFGEGRYSDVLDLYEGPFLESVRYKMSPELARWAEAEETRLQVLVDEAFEGAVRHRMERGSVDDAIETARRWLDLNPLSERRLLLLVRVLRWAGRPSHALQEMERFRSLLQSELDDVPSGSWRQIHEAVRRDVEVARPEVELERETPPVGAEMTGVSDDRRVGESQPSEGDLARRRGLVALGVAFAGLVALIALYDDRPRPIAILTAYDGPLAGNLRIARSGVSFEVSPDGLGPNSVPSPVRDEWARHERTPGGADLVLEDGDGTTRTILSSPADEHPLGWSPDGERLLYRRGRYHRAENEYRVRLGTWDRSSGETVEFPVPGFDGAVRATWSPDGSRIAVGGGPRLMVTTPDGQVLTTTTDAMEFREPRWSPSGRHIAVSVWDGTPADVYLVDPNTADMVPVVETLGHESAIAWLTDRYLLAISEVAGQRHLVLIDVGTGDLVVVEDDIPVDGLGYPRWDMRLGDAAIERLFQARRATDRRAFVDSIEIDGPTGSLSVGEFAIFSAVPLSGDRGLLLGVPTAPTWTTRMGLVSSIGSGLLRASDPGIDELMVSYPGWRSSRVEVEVRRPVRRSALPALEERWDEDWSHRWHPFGDPVPRIRAVSGDAPGPRVFEARGDQNYASGVLSTRAYSTVDGLTVEFWSRAVLSQPLFQSWALGFTQERFAKMPADRFSAMDGSARVAFVNRHPRTLLAGIDQQYLIPLPDSTNRWRRYALQVTPEGEQRLFVDGLIHVRAPAPADWVAGDSARVILSGQGINAEIVQGPLTIYEGELYGWEEDPGLRP